jgi:hypothetical protein
MSEKSVILTCETRYSLLWPYLSLRGRWLNNENSCADYVGAMGLGHDRTISGGAEHPMNFYNFQTIEWLWIQFSLVAMFIFHILHKYNLNELHIFHNIWYQWSIHLITLCFTDRSGHQKLIPSQSCQHLRHGPRLCHPWSIQCHWTRGFSYMVLLHPNHDFWRSWAFQMEPFWLN